MRSSDDFLAIGPDTPGQRSSRVSVKSKALFHLLQSRVQNLDVGVPRTTREVLHEVCGSLSVQHADSTYRLSWHVAGERRDLTVPAQRFTFYVPGDRTGPGADSHSGRNYRSENWTAALELWNQIAEASGVGLPTDRTDSGDRTTPSGLWLAVATMAVAALAAFTIADARMAWHVAIAAICSYGLARFVCATEQGRVLRPLEGAVAGIAALLPVVLGGDPAPYAMALIGVLLVCAIERSAREQIVLWVLGGAGCGIAAALGGAAAIAGNGVFVVTVTALIGATPGKGRRPVLLGFAAAALIAGTASMFVFAEPVKTPGPPALVSGDAGLVAGLLVAAMLFAGFLLWWVLGVMQFVTPWMALLASATTIAMAQATGQAGLVRAGSAAAGVAIVVASRLTSRWRFSLRGPRSNIPSFDLG